MSNNNSFYPTSGRAWLTVFILLLCYILSFIDRQILNLLVDSFPPEKRATAISVYSMGIYLGAGIAFLLGDLNPVWALVTDYVFGYDDAIRYSLFIVASVATSAAIVLLWMGLKPYRESRLTLEQWGARQPAES